MRPVLASVALAWLLAACGSSPSPTPSSSPGGDGPGARLGTFDIASGSGASVGSVSLERVDPAIVRATVRIVDRLAVHPWSIYDQPACGPPAAKRDAPFQFADIEAGERTEDLEAAPFLEFPGHLVLVVMHSDGSPLYGCADLGQASASAEPPSPDAACAVPPKVGPPGLGRPELAFSADALSNADIYLAADDGSNVRRLTTAVGIDIKPSWSPDGEQLAFRSVRDGQDEIYVMRADGTCQRNLTNDPADDRSPAWSPDGRTIAFDHFFGDRFQDVAVIDVPAGTALRAVSRASGEYPAWSPDGSQIAFASARDGDYEIFVINADGSGERQLTHNRGYDMYPAWSPDGAWIAFESDVDASSLELHLMRSDGSGDRRLTTDDLEDRFPAWSKDGRMAWSRDGAIVVAAGPGDPPHEIGRGQFAAWRP